MTAMAILMAHRKTHGNQKFVTLAKVQWLRALKARLVNSWKW